MSEEKPQYARSTDTNAPESVAVENRYALEQPSAVVASTETGKLEVQPVEDAPAVVISEPSRPPAEPETMLPEPSNIEILTGEETPATYDPLVDGISCSMCRAVVKGDQILKSPLSFETDANGVVVPSDVAFSLFCKKDMTFLMIYHPRKKEG